MTLLMHVGFQDDFVLVTSDTARRKKYFNPINLEGNGLFGELQETREKLFKVTDTVFGTLGGLLFIGHAYMSRLLARVKPDDCLDICEEYLSEIADEINEEKHDRLFKKYRVSKEYQVTLMGYYKDGTPGIVGIIGGKLEKASGGILSNAFTPTAEVGELTGDIMTDAVFKYLIKLDVNEVISNLAHFQAAVSFTHPEIVSSTMMYMGIKKSLSGELVSFEGEIDLKDLIASFEIEEG
ncbi:hypothetical protein PB01_08065 [Psychrobacillus glaciei]|uniref:Uncharacterized protein n=1 Tax=Psychrobacillus glaciei TaxID=2283160 RepID=A0A5J6SLD0_9BACI|nr:hypothetical protein [Psychrobacillus glaciei]QFF98790.1 hypothetical protein PB01_08065 [Psychrobacillus glaciei]